MALIPVIPTNTIMPNRYLSVGYTGSGYTLPITFSVKAGGAGGTIDPGGLYHAPNAKGIDTIVLTDASLTPVTAEVTVITTGVLEIFCNIIQTELGLTSDRVWLWDQKIMQPKDHGLYIAVQVVSCKPFSNTRQSSSDGLDAVQSTNFQATLQLDIISRGVDARDRKEEVLMALNSVYSQQQQTANGFFIAPISSQFNNLSQEDGAAIPYRFNITCNILYSVTKIKTVPYYDTFSVVSVTTDP
jgi:hypothetical protein